MKNPNYTINSLNTPATIDEAHTAALQDAVDHVKRYPREEAGGFLFKRHKEGKADIVFCPVRNQHESTTIALGLYEPDYEQFKEKTGEMYSEGYHLYATFHSHPLFEETLSSIDLLELFQNANVNYIYGGLSGNMNRYTWTGKDYSELIGQQVQFSY